MKITNIYVSVIRNHFLTSYRQYFVFFNLILFFSIFLVCNNIVKSFKNTFIEQLKGLYPNAFLLTHGQKVDIDDVGLDLEKEILYLSKNLEIKFSENTNSVIIFNVGFRSTKSQFAPKLVRKSLKDEKSVLFNSALWKRIYKNHKQDQKKLYLVGDKNKLVYVKVMKFDMAGSKPWIYMPDSLSKELNLGENITSIYTENYDNIEKIVSNSGINFQVVRWTERIPFSDEMFYKLMNMAFYIFTICLFIVVCIMIMGITKDSIDEIKKLISFSVFYGISKKFILTFFCSAINVYFLANLLLSYFLGLFILYSIEKLLKFNCSNIIIYNQSSLSVLIMVLLLCNFACIRVVNNESNKNFIS